MLLPLRTWKSQAERHVLKKIPIHFTKQSIVLAAAYLGILTVFYTLHVKRQLRQPNLLAAFVFDTGAARKEKHLAVISLIQSGEAHLQKQDFHHQA